VAFIRLVAVQKIVELTGELSPVLRKAKDAWMRVLYRLYAKSAGISEKDNASAFDVIQDFVTRRDYDAFQIETIHHVVLFSELPPDLLALLAEHLFSDRRVGNVYHEKFKIKLFSIILRKLAAPGESGAFSDITDGIKEYAVRNERASGLITDFSQLYLDLAVYYSGFSNGTKENEAMECFLRFSRINQRDVKFEGRTAEFYRRVGGKAKVEQFEEKLTLGNEKAIYEEILSVFAESVQRNREDIDRRIHAVIEGLFYDVCHAEIRKCDEAGDPCAECSTEVTCDPGINVRTVRRGHTFRSIPIGSGHYLFVQYPTNLESVFLQLLEKRMAFIKTNLSSLLTIGLKNRELTRANQSLDREIRTDRLTGLPNKWQFERDSAEGFGTANAVDAMLVSIDNFSDINVLYGAEEVGDAFLVDVTKKVFLQFFHGDNWRTYRVRSDQLIVVRTGESVSPINKMTENLKMLAESYCFSSNESEAIRIRAQVSISYCEGQREAVGKKLQLALRDGKNNGQTIARFDPATYEENERQLAANLEGSIVVTEAIWEKRVVPHYQAIVDNLTGEVVKYESLARIRKRDGQWLEGTRFIEHAKQIHLLPLLAKEVINGACTDFKNDGRAFSINLSRQDLFAPDFIEDFKQTLAIFDIAP
jgi:GGDEF domain-containing protein